MIRSIYLHDDKITLQEGVAELPSHGGFLWLDVGHPCEADLVLLRELYQVDPSSRIQAFTRTASTYICSPNWSRWANAANQSSIR